MITEQEWKDRYHSREEIIWRSNRSPMEKLILLLILRYLGGTKDQCSLSIGTLSIRSGINRISVEDLINGLGINHVLKRKKRTYSINWEELTTFRTKSGDTTP